MIGLGTLIRGAIRANITARFNAAVDALFDQRTTEEALIAYGIAARSSAEMVFFNNYCTAQDSRGDAATIKRFIAGIDRLSAHGGFENIAASLVKVPLITPNIDADFAAVAAHRLIDIVETIVMADPEEGCFNAVGHLLGPTEIRPYDALSDDLLNHAIDLINHRGRHDAVQARACVAEYFPHAGDRQVFAPALADGPHFTPNADR